MARVIPEIPKTSLGEGPLWDGEALIYVDIVAGLIHRHSFEEGTHETIAVGENVGFAVLDRQGAVVAGVGNGSICRFRFGSEGRETLAPPARDLAENLANDGKCDRRGRLWAGTKSREGSAVDTGYLARLDAERGLQKEWLHPVHISNGLAWSPDNTKMYYNDSTDRIWVFDYEMESGTIANRRVFAKLAADGAVPDGMTIDSAGALYVAMWGGSRVDVYRDVDGVGVRTGSIEFPTALQVTSVAFGGSDMRTLFVTSASVGLTPAEMERYPDSGRIFAVEMAVAGLAETCFEDAAQGGR